MAHGPHNYDGDDPYGQVCFTKNNCTFRENGMTEVPQDHQAPGDHQDPRGQEMTVMT